jgi:hypothetical protein
MVARAESCDGLFDNYHSQFVMGFTLGRTIDRNGVSIWQIFGLPPSTSSMVEFEQNAVLRYAI